MAQRSRILVRTGPDDNRDSCRFIVPMLLIFAYGRTCSILIWRVIPHVKGEYDFEIVTIIGHCIQILCLTGMVAELLKRKNERILRILAGLLLLVGPLANLWDYCHVSYGDIFLGYEFDSDQQPITTGIAHLLTSTSWDEVLLVLCILIASAKQRSLHWTRAGAAVCAGLALEFILPSGMHEFLPPNNGSVVSWIFYASLFAPIIMTICFITQHYIGYGAFLLLVVSGAFGVWELFDTWFRTYPSHLNWLQNMWSVLLSFPSTIGPTLLILWYAWRKPIVELPDDGSPWPRRYCAKCFYNLHGLETERCPECGAAF